MECLGLISAGDASDSPAANPQQQTRTDASERPPDSARDDASERSPDVRAASDKSPDAPSDAGDSEAVPSSLNERPSYPGRPGQLNHKELRAARRRGLEAFELDSVSDMSEKSQEISFFLQGAQAEQARHREAKMRSQQEPELGLEDMPPVLESFEERELGMALKRAKASAEPRADDSSSEPSPPSSDEEEEEEEEDEEFDSRLVRQAAVRDGFKVFEVQMDRGWAVPPGATWKHSGDSGGLVAEKSTMEATHVGTHLRDFDIECEVMISAGKQAGLIFREGHHLVLNLQDQRAEFWRPGAVINLGPMAVLRGTWYKLRVRSIESTLSLFVASRLLWQNTRYFAGETVLCVAAEATCTITKDHGDRTYSADFETGAQVHAKGSEFRRLPGTVGLFVKRAVANVRKIFVIDLEAMFEREKQSRQVFEEAARENQIAKEQSRRRREAAAFIQEVARLNFMLMRQRMMVCRQAERQGRQEKVRERTLLRWCALLSVFQRFNDCMATSKMQELRHLNDRKILDVVEPPPPAAPWEPPPGDDTISLQVKYDLIREKVGPRWERAGRMAFGRKAFHEMLDKDLGFMEKERRKVAERLRDMMEEKSISQEEFKGLSQKAYVLSEG